ncbi:hypothetical protein SAMN04489723_11541 [Algoriphagus aquimarinus]|uniref:Uncharacterized protein n=1 Tax=Algoriphagus aquimarinus TaxID=237018 RepID=A0A1I1BSL8_9BACT|nr:hypothetical protein SAMN04489723_11541 [Algoriphagus aquimarinus]
MGSTKYNCGSHIFLYLTGFAKEFVFNFDVQIGFLHTNICHEYKFR